MERNNFIRQANITLKISKNANKFVANNNTIVLAMTGNSYFPNLATKVMQFETVNKLLEKTEAAFNSTPQRATKQERNNVFQLVVKILRAIGRGVQDVADDDIVNAEAIIKSAGFTVRKSGSRNIPYNTAKDGDEEGSVVLKGDGPGAHDWRMSIDNKEWYYLPSSKKSTKIIRNLVSGTLYYFQNCKALARDEKGEWSPSIKFRIQ